MTRRPALLRLLIATVGLLASCALREPPPPSAPEIAAARTSWASVEATIERDPTAARGVLEDYVRDWPRSEKAGRAPFPGTA